MANPPPIQVPLQFQRDPQLNDFFKRLLKVIYQLWEGEGGGGSTGGGTPGTGGGSGGGGGGGGSSSTTLDPAGPGALLARAGSALLELDALATAGAMPNPVLLAHLGHLITELESLAARPIAVQQTFNRITAAGDIRVTADGALRINRAWQ